MNAEKEKLKIGFIILHYNTLDVTVQVIEKIQKNIDILETEYRIIVVDNASPNKTGKDLAERYKSASNVIVICNPQNMGFAKGNNTGFQYLKKCYDVEYIVMMNNDVLLLEQNFYKKISKAFVDSAFDVAGPLILAGNKRYDVNPVEYRPHEKEYFEMLLKRCRLEITLYRFHLHFLWTAVRWLRHLRKTPRATFDYLTEQTNVKLHGCFWIFSKNYIRDFDGINPNTFMYVEEDILYTEMMKQNRKTLYLPNIIVFHFEDAATNSVSRKTREKELFILREHLKSYQVLLDIYGSMEQ